SVYTLVHLSTFALNSRLRRLQPSATSLSFSLAFSLFLLILSCAIIRKFERKIRDFFFFQAEDGIRDPLVTGVQTCALPISSPGSCNDTFGTRTPGSGGAPIGSGNRPVDYSQARTGLTPGTTYFFCALAQNGAGTSVGSVLSFTPPVAPSVTTDPASSIGSTTATLNGSANPHGAATTGWFRYATASPGSCDDTFGT